MTLKLIPYHSTTMEVPITFVLFAYSIVFNVIIILIFDLELKMKLRKEELHSFASGRRSDNIQDVELSKGSISHVKLDLLSSY